MKFVLGGQLLLLMLFFVNILIEFFREDSQVDVNYNNFAKAFDTVNHDSYLSA